MKKIISKISASLLHRNSMSIPRVFINMQCTSIQETFMQSKMIKNTGHVDVGTIDCPILEETYRICFTLTNHIYHAQKIGMTTKP